MTALDASLRGLAQPARFAAVGVINTGIDVGIYLLLSAFGTPVVLANLVSTCCGLAFSFAANRGFTFSDRVSSAPRKQAVLFLLVTGVGLWCVQPLVLLAFAAPAERALSGSDLMATVVPKLAAVLVGLVWNYLWYSRFVFRSRVAMTTGQTGVMSRDDA
ncbi:GtrA family protein [Amnibacterium endophyticum]|uniref:GtrA family protein n=1 Tax=Amnibacterium endophyticum TaxID=2109337 RepID=A0ABW4LBB6_9MICO